jgi:signal transduction histidine kinase
MIKNRSIVTKLFFITTTVLSIFIFLSLAFQIIFYNDFYVVEKKKILKSNIETFLDEYEDASENKRRELVNEFNIDNNSPIIVLDEHMNPKYYDYNLDNFIVVESGDEKYRVLTDAMNFDYKEGDEIALKGYLLEDDIIEPYVLGESNFIDPINIEEADNELVDTRATVIYSNIANSIVDIDMSNNIMYSNETDILLDNIKFNQSGEELLEDVIDYDGKSYYVIGREFEENGKKMYIYTMSGYQVVDEMQSIITSYYYYIFAMLLVAIIVLSYIYSRIIARPLIRLKNISEKMAKLEFDEVAIIESNDEIGDLSRNLNMLSTKLGMTLKNLDGANEKLKSDIAIEKEREELRKDFVSTLSHELKTPLGIIRSYSEALKENIKEEKKDKYVDIINEEVINMNKMIEEMIETNNIETKIEVKPKAINFKEMFDSVFDRFNQTMVDSNLKVDIDIKEYSVLVNRYYIEKVLNNFISNAIRYTKENGKIKISNKKMNDKIYFYIENESESIETEKLNKIWDKFYRIDKSRSRELGGSGLGLYIVSKILERHNSDYGVYNTGLGIEFYFSLDEA